MQKPFGATWHARTVAGRCRQHAEGSVGVLTEPACRKVRQQPGSGEGSEQGHFHARDQQAAEVTSAQAGPRCGVPLACH